MPIELEPTLYILYLKNCLVYIVKIFMLKNYEFAVSNMYIKDHIKKKFNINIEDYNLSIPSSLKTCFNEGCQYNYNIEEYNFSIFEKLIAKYYFDNYIKDYNLNNKCVFNITYRDIFDIVNKVKN